MKISEPPTNVPLRPGDREGGGSWDRRWGRTARHQVPENKGTQAVSMCAQKHMGRGGLRGSAHLGLKSSSDRRYLRGVGVQSGQKCPLCSSAREYRQGRPVHKGRTTARQVRPYAWPGHRTHISMQDQRLHAPQGRADVSPEHGWGGLSRPALNFHPQICGTRGGYVSGVKYVSLWQTCDMYIPGKPRCVQ